MEQPLVYIIMGSDSDAAVMQETADTLQSFNIPFEMTIASAHRSPQRAAHLARTARERGVRVIIAAAGWAAHLAGVLASHTTLPVIGVPIESSPLNGLDALLSTVQMPGGVPVATMSLGRAGACNAAVFAAQILALQDPVLQKAVADYKDGLERSVAQKAERFPGGQ